MNLMVYLGHKSVILYIILLRSCQEYGRYMGPSFAVMADEDLDKRDLDSCGSELTDVCASLLKVGSNEPIKEGFNADGNICMCDGCNAGWDEHDGKSLTWYHYERDEWVVQYKFCEKIVPERVCDENDRNAVSVVVHHDKWDPAVEKFNCRCRSDRYYIEGWMSVKVMGSNYWRYTFVCSKPPCEKKGECVRKYLDYTGTQTTGFQFPCSCPKDYSCPLVKDSPTSHNINGKDHRGPFIKGACEKDI